MLWLNLKRIMRSGFVNFWRNGYVSFASVVVMVVTLFVISSIIFTNAMLSSVLDTLKTKVDINVYFVNDAPESSILSIKRQVESLPEVAEATYLTREEALVAFKKKHENDQTILQALSELGENPLGAVLNVRAKETSQYESIANFLDSQQQAGESTIIEKVTYFENKEAIDALTRIIDASKQLGGVITAIFVLVSIVITFNTIRLAIYISREEIAVMKLVGASYMYIRGPFVVGGIMAGIVAALISLVLLYPLTYWLGPTTEKLFAGISIWQYYTSHFAELFVILVISGAFIGAVSSYLAVRKYLAK